MIFSVLAVASLIGAAFVGLSASKDNKILRETALSVIKDINNTADKVIALNKWVYCNRGFKKNSGYYLLKRLEATPMQIYRDGGDCADKSRLLSVMLDEIGIRSSLVMLYSSQNSNPVHTVVYAWHESGVMAVDPVFDIDFPDEKGCYLPVQSLISDDCVLTDRINELCCERGETDKINYYNVETHHYRFATTFNWNKNFLTRITASLISAIGIDPATLPRPRLFEDPKLTIAATLTILGIFFGISAILLFWIG